MTPEQAATEALAFVESGRQVGLDGTSAFAVTGRPFVCFACSPKTEGLLGDTYEKIEEALAAFKAAFCCYAETAQGSVLYWRRRPVCECLDNGTWRIYARLLLDQPSQGVHA